MRRNFKLFIAVGKASVITTIGSFFLVFGFRVTRTPRAESILGVLMAFLPAGVAAWWMVRNLRDDYTKREARSVAIAFALVAPVALLVGTLFAEILGGYAGFLGRPFGLLGSFVGIVSTITIGSLAPCLIVLWLTRRKQDADH